MQVFERQFTFVQLAVWKNSIDKSLDETLYSWGCGIVKGSWSRFNHIRQHDEAGFPGLRLGAGVAEVINVYRIFAFQLFGLFIEVLDVAGPVVLPDGVYNILTEFVCSGNFHTFFNMGD